MYLCKFVRHAALLLRSRGGVMGGKLIYLIGPMSDQCVYVWRGLRGYETLQ